MGSSTSTGVVNRGRLASDLARVLEGEARFDEGSRALYANDASIYRQLPLGVVLPRHADDVVAALGVLREHGVPIAARGCGTGLAGQSTTSGVIIDFSKYMRQIRELDPARRIARVQPGVVCDQLRAAAAEHGLTFAVDPATHDRNTLGGMIGNNSCGTHSVWGGKTVDNVLELDVLCYDGTRMLVGPTDEATYQEVVAAGGRRAEIYRRCRELVEHHAGMIRERFPDIPRRVSGYNLPDLLPENEFDLAKALVGSESSCVLVLEATVRLLPDPPHHSLLVIGYPDAPTAADHVPDFLGTDPIGLECFDAGVIANMRLHGARDPGIELPEGSAWLLIEYGAESQDEVNAHVERVRSRVEAGNPTVFEESIDQERVWEIRRSAIEFTRVPGRHAGLAGWEDAAVAPEQLGAYLREYLALIGRHGYHTVVFGHFGQGCMHNRLDLRLTTRAEVNNFGQFLREAGDLVVRFGGSLSGEHGDGQLRADQLEKMFGADMVELFGRFKAIFDPDGRMNPGKIVNPYPPTANLGLVTGYQPRPVHTHFQFPEDQLGFADAVNRCFGIGKCRHESGGTMCPSYMVTHEEQHSTRGRARLLLEMMGGHLSDRSPAGRTSGWRDEHVKQALDLCLACKGCKGDCPVSVDMATYKAEFLSHFYAGRPRPIEAYAMGLLPVWARMAAHAPRLANGALSAPGFGRAVRALAGVDTRRHAPRFARRTFRSWFATHSSRPHGPRVLLWPDTFTNYFTPEVGVAAVTVLESAGYTVGIPDCVLCCGRPLYDYGMLSTAKRWLRRLLSELAEPISAGTPIVGIEPSCVAVFRDELTNLFPADLNAQRLARQSVTLAELLATTEDYTPPMLHRRVLGQMHCHQSAVIGIDADQQLLRRMGAELQLPDSGCCGMAGSFGYGAGDHYEVSMAAGERVILPAIRAASPDTLVLADGFSCRSQIEHATNRKALHLAEIMAMATRQPTAGSREQP